MKKKILSLFGITILSIGLVLGLYYSAETSNDSSNGFKRLFKPHFLRYVREMKIEGNIWHFCGSDSTHVYLSNKIYVNTVLDIDTNLFKSKIHTISLKDLKSTNIKFSDVSTHILNGRFFIMDGTLPAIYSGSIKNWEVEQLERRGKYFNLGIPLSDSSFIFRVVYPKDGFKLSTASFATNTFKTGKQTLIKQVDGFICEDGMLIYNSELNKLIYVYYYRNQFPVMDTSLNVLHQASTIDTNSNAKLRLTKIKSTGEVKIATPLTPVNKRISTSGNYLYVNSSLLADNENREIFRSAEVIDIYNLTTTNYISSFYIPDYRGGKIKDFKIVGDNLFALYNGMICLYKINPVYLVN